MVGDGKKPMKQFIQHLKSGKPEFCLEHYLEVVFKTNIAELGTENVCLA